MRRIEGKRPCHSRWRRRRGRAASRSKQGAVSGQCVTLELSQHKPPRQTRLDVPLEVLQPSLPLIILGPLGSIDRNLSAIPQRSTFDLLFRQVPDPIRILLLQPRAFLAVVVVRVRDRPDDGEEDGPVSGRELGFPTEQRGGNAGMFEGFEGGWGRTRSGFYGFGSDRRSGCGWGLDRW